MSNYDHDVDLYDTQWRFNLIALRLRVSKGDLIPFQSMDTAIVNGDVVVWVATKTEHHTFTDDADMFPSDKLITQLRILSKK